MSSIVIAGDTSGSVTLQAPAVSGSTVLNLPATSGTIQASGAGYTTNGVAYATSATGLATGSALTFDGTNFATTGKSFSASVGVGTNLYAGIGMSGGGDNAFWRAYATHIWQNVTDPSTATTGTELMRLNTTGLGIGTSSPYAKIQVAQSSSTLPVNWIYRGNQTLDNNLPTTYGFPYLHIGRSEYRVGSLQTIGFGYVSANGGNPPAEIGYLCATVSGETYGDLVFATRSVTTNTAATERTRIDSSGRLIIQNGPLTTSTSSVKGLQMYFDATNNQAYIYSTQSGVANYPLNVNASTLALGSSLTTFSISGVEAGRFDSSGNLLVGTTTTLGNGFAFQPNGSDTNVPLLSVNGNSSSNTLASFRLWSTSLSQNQFYVGYGGTIYARSTSITGLSDISEKENIRDLETGINTVLALQPRRFDWKNGSGENVAGFIAQEVQSVLPDLVESYKVSEDETKLGLKMGDMIPTLVKAIQEQQALITSLTERITALEGV